MSNPPAWYQPPPKHDSADGWAALYRVSSLGLVALMIAGQFLYPHVDAQLSGQRDAAAASPPAFLPYIPLALIALGTAWTLFAPQNRKLRFVLFPVYATSMGAYYLLGPWWGLGLSQGGSYVVQAAKMMTEPPQSSLEP